MLGVNLQLKEMDKDTDNKNDNGASAKEEHSVDKQYY